LCERSVWRSSLLHKTLFRLFFFPFVVFKGISFFFSPSLTLPPLFYSSNDHFLQLLPPLRIPKTFSSIRHGPPPTFLDGRGRPFFFLRPFGQPPTRTPSSAITSLIYPHLRLPFFFPPVTRKTTPLSCSSLFNIPRCITDLFLPPSTLRGTRLTLRRQPPLPISSVSYRKLKDTLIPPPPLPTYIMELSLVFFLVIPLLSHSKQQIPPGGAYFKPSRPFRPPPPNFFSVPGA